MIMKRLSAVKIGPMRLIKKTTVEKYPLLT